MLPWNTKPEFKARLITVLRCLTTHKTLSKTWSLESNLQVDRGFTEKKKKKENFFYLVSAALMTCLAYSKCSLYIGCINE